MGLSWDHFNSSLRTKTHIWPQQQYFACADFQENLTHLHSNWAQFQKAQLTPYKTMYAFSRSPPGQGVMLTNLFPVIAPRMEPSYTHFH